MAEELDITPSTLSYHLDILREAGVIEKQYCKTSRKKL